MTAKERPAGGASGPKGQKFKSPASSLRQIAVRAQVLVIEHATTADLPDGRQMPPLGDGWHAVGRITGTRWRRIALPNPTNDELCRRRRRRLEQRERAEKWRPPWTSRST
jgi:hypothetical protein